MKLHVPGRRAVKPAVAVLFLLAFASGPVVEARVLRVPSEYPRIRDAVPAAAEGDTVLVAPGDYVGDGFSPRMSMTLLSEGGRDVTFISAGGSYLELFDPWVGNSIKISGFTFRDCLGAVFVFWSGGILANPRLEIGDCNFIRCGGGTQPPWRGAVLVSPNGNGSQNFGLDIHDCVFEGNTCLGWGASIGIAGAVTGEIRNNRFTGNVAVRGGGVGTRGVNLYAGPGIIIRDNEFIDNIAVGDGGNAAEGAGISVWASRYVKVTANVFRGNRAAHGGGSFPGLGGAVAIGEPRSSLVEITENLMVGNHAGDVGGAIASIESLAGIVVSRNTIVGCEALHGGGIGVVSPPATVSIENNIVADATGSGLYFSGSPSNLATGCNDAWNTTPPFEGCVPSPTDFSADPRFCDPSAGDYTIAANSPCAPENSPVGCGLIGAYGVGCGVIGVPVSDAPAADKRLTINPNPVRGVARFEVGQMAPFTTLSIFDSQGRLVEQLMGKEGHWEWAPGASVPAGVYFAVPGASSKATEGAKFLYLR
jgi:hypothetical protein